MTCLITETPLGGRILAFKIVRKTIVIIQTNSEAKLSVRKQYAEDPMMHCVLLN